MCKKNVRFFYRFCLPSLVLACLLTVFGCSNSVETMMEDYNSAFSVVPVTTTSDSHTEYSVDNVVANAMLLPEYPVKYRTTLNLAAPTGAASYLWEVEVSENAAGLEEGTVYTLSNGRVLVLYIKDSILKQWAHYKLTLTVVKTNGEILKDTAMLYVY